MPEVSPLLTQLAVVYRRMKYHETDLTVTTEAETGLERKCKLKFYVVAVGYVLRY